MRTPHLRSPDVWSDHAPTPVSNHHTGRKIAGVFLAGGLALSGCGSTETAEIPARAAAASATPESPSTISATQRSLPTPSTSARSTAPGRKPAGGTPSPTSAKPSLGSGGRNDTAVEGSPVKCTGLDISGGRTGADGSYTVTVQPIVEAVKGAAPNPATILTIGQLAQRKGADTTIIVAAGPNSKGGLGAPITMVFETEPELNKNTAMAPLFVVDMTGIDPSRWPSPATPEAALPLLTATSFNGRPLEPCGEVSSQIAFADFAEQMDEELK